MNNQPWQAYYMLRIKEMYYCNPQPRMDYNSVFEAGPLLVCKDIRLHSLVLVAKHNVVIIGRDIPNYHCSL